MCGVIQQYASCWTQKAGLIKKRADTQQALICLCTYTLRIRKQPFNREDN